MICCNRDILNSCRDRWKYFFSGELTVNNIAERGEKTVDKYSLHKQDSKL
jgi:hypothetical protein